MPEKVEHYVLKRCCVLQMPIFPQESSTHNAHTPLAFLRSSPLCRRQLRFLCACSSRPICCHSKEPFLLHHVRDPNLHLGARAGFPVAAVQEPKATAVFYFTRGVGKRHGGRIRDWCCLLVEGPKLIIGGPKSIVRGTRGSRCDWLNPRLVATKRVLDEWLVGKRL